MDWSVDNNRMAQEDKLTTRTITIIKKKGRILLKDKSGWYLHAWTNIAAGPDRAVWGRQKNALEFFNLKWAFTIASLYKCKVVVVYPKGTK